MAVTIQGSAPSPAQKLAFQQAFNVPDATAVAIDVAAAQAAKTAAEAARDSINTTGKVFTAAEGTTAGIAATTSGQQFAVLAADSLSWLIYRNNAGAALAVGPGSYTRMYIDATLDKSGKRWLFRRPLSHAFTGPNGRAAAGITSDDGTLLAKLPLLSTGDLSIVRSALTGLYTLAIGVVKSLQFQGGGLVSARYLRYFNREAVAHLLADAAGRTGIAIGVGGTAYIPKPYLPPVISPGPVAVLGGVLIRAELRAGRYQLVCVGGDGVETLLTTLGNNNNPVIEGGNVLYLSDRGTAFPRLVAEHYWQPITGGAEKRVLPVMTAIFGIGDSLSRSTYQPYLQALLGVPVLVRGIGGQNSLMIAMRQGGLPVYLTLASNSVASGPNTVTAINGTATGGVIGGDTSPLFLSSPASNGAITATGWLELGANRVYGTVSRTGTNGPPSTVEAYTFTPSTNIALPLACPAGTSFTVEEGTTYADYPQVIWAGSNDVTLWPTDTATTLARIAAMVARLNPLRARFVIVGPTIQDAFPLGNAYHAGFNAVRAALAAAYPGNFIDMHNKLVTEGLARAGLTATANDLADIANDLIPRQLRADAIHPNALAHPVEAQIIKEFFNAKGWY